ncbi:MAG: hypothetical protein J6B05_04015, partial [Clostridia bacterium]|nr:hypothetical protein [Clostridia bacterium]
SEITFVFSFIAKAYRLVCAGAKCFWWHSHQSVETPMTFVLYSTLCLRTFLARTPDNAGTLALCPKAHEKRHTVWYAFFRGWGEVIRTPE